jgi:hypothetical protein
MAAPIEFSVVQTDDGSRLGKLRVPYRKSADWINFLVSPRQCVQIIFSENQRSNLILYFQADERLYTYLEQTLLQRQAADSSPELAATAT